MSNSKFCLKELPCGHDCEDPPNTTPCSPCSRICIVNPGCSHSVELECKNRSAIIKCTLICGKVLPCSHKCSRSCNKVCECDICLSVEAAFDGPSTSKVALESIRSPPTLKLYTPPPVQKKRQGKHFLPQIQNNTNGATADSPPISPTGNVKAISDPEFKFPKSIVISCCTNGHIMGEGASVCQLCNEPPQDFDILIENCKLADDQPEEKKEVKLPYDTEEDELELWKTGYAKCSSGHFYFVEDGKCGECNEPLFFR